MRPALSPLLLAPSPFAPPGSVPPGRAPGPRPHPRGMRMPSTLPDRPLAPDRDRPLLPIPRAVARGIVALLP